MLLSLASPVSSLLQKKEHRSVKSIFFFLIIIGKQSILKSLSLESSLPAGLFIDIQKFLNKQGIRRRAITPPAMERQQVDAKKPAISLKFSLANRAAIEIFAFLFLASGES